ncbi:hypothetical protein [Candidatus Amarobacter glycogenicus]|uniref:beta-ketoacyl-[acyl-carrier-protein] synthase family protein n=1 Tax=Candidatus Amarobacter glycogenicus TaxID=3140699 RepID=UPI0031CC8F98
MLLESEEHALARGARIYAEVAGFGCTNDAYHVAAPPEDGEGAGRAMALAMKDAGITAEQVDYVNAHATSTPLGDTAETNAVKRALGEHAYRVAISATKSLIGHGLGASGGMETVATVKTIETGIIHPTINLHPGSVLRPRLRPQRRPPSRCEGRAQEQFWLWRPEQLPRHREVREVKGRG